MAHNPKLPTPRGVDPYADPTGDDFHPIDDAARELFVIQYTWRDLSVLTRLRDDHTLPVLVPAMPNLARTVLGRYVVLEAHSLCDMLKSYAKHAPDALTDEYKAISRAFHQSVEAVNPRFKDARNTFLAHRDGEIAADTARSYLRLVDQPEFLEMLRAMAAFITAIQELPVGNWGRSRTDPKTGRVLAERISPIRLPK